MQNFRKIFEEMDFNTERGLNDHVLIFDGLNLFLRIFSAVPAISDVGEHVGGTIGFLKSLAWNIRHFDPTRCIVVFDGKGGSTRRRKLYPEYKMNRINKTTFNRYDEFATPEDEEASMRMQMARIAQYLNILPVSTLQIDMVEADDVIAYLSQINRGKSTIVSTDKDFLQLIDDDTQVWRPTTKKLHTRTEIMEDYNFLPENFLIHRLFEGDGSDNIPGIKGIGRKTLLKEFPQLSTEKIDYTFLIEKSKELVADGNKKKFFSIIAENEDVLHRNYKLMQLKHLDISGEIKTRVQRMYGVTPEKMNDLLIRRYLLEDRFHMSIKDVEGWLHKSFTELNKHAK